MNRGLGFFSGTGDTLWKPALLLPLFSSDLTLLPLLTLGILPRLWSGWGRGDIRPSFSGDPGEDSFSLARFLESLSSFPFTRDLEPDLPPLLSLEPEDFELELDFLESDFDLLEGLLSFLVLSESLAVLTSDFLSTLASFLSVLGLRLGSRLLLGSLDS